MIGSDKVVMKTEVVASAEESQEEARLIRQERFRAAVWRDLFFLLLGAVVLRIVSYVETHAADADIRGAGTQIMSTSISTATTAHPSSIVDAGFILTAPLHLFLANNPRHNDLFALLNSIFFLIPFIYAAKITLWQGDYRLSFRLIATQLFRSLCGWFTYLPPDPAFLMSYYDFPEVAQCLFQECLASEDQVKEILPFVSFFSGHVATCVIVANHMYINKYTKCAVVMHLLNVLQIIRLLATRGHYSIDIIIGWCVAVYVSNPAERLGRYYSRGMKFSEMVPGNAVDAFETVTGVKDMRIGTRSERPVPYMEYIRDQNGFTNHGVVEGASTTTTTTTGKSSVSSSVYGEVHEEYYIVKSETSARIAAEIASDFAKRNLGELRSDLSKLGLQLQEIGELRRNDMIRLLSLAQLKMDELRTEASLLDVSVTEGMSRRDILLTLMLRMKDVVEATIRPALRGTLSGDNKKSEDDVILDKVDAALSLVVKGEEEETLKVS